MKYFIVLAFVIAAMATIVMAEPEAMPEGEHGGHAAHAEAEAEAEAGALTSAPMLSLVVSSLLFALFK